ncbi:cytochrome P450 [Mycena galopus ATCC 62051]|nr:cytochrome P450 [Mycena galopus ATCC 62051]
MNSPVLIWGTALGLVNHFLFHKHEPSSGNIPFLLLMVQPIALFVPVGGPYTSFRLFWSYVVFLGALSLSIATYRLSPFHPLAQYPGPAISKATKLGSLWKASQGHKYLYYKVLHDKYGPYLRTGPNEISIIDAAAVGQILGFGGLGKGRYYESGKHRTTPPSIVCLTGEVHTAKRRVWNRAMASSSRIRALGREARYSTVHWIELFAYDSLVLLTCALTVHRFDLMGNLAFGGGFEMLRDGKDVDGVGARIRGFMKASQLAALIPWIINTLHRFPQVGRIIQEFNGFGQNLAIRRMKSGAMKINLWYHFLLWADEAGLEKEKPTLEIAAADGIFLLSEPEYYRRVKQELDSVIVHGDDPPDYFSHPDQFLPGMWLPDSKFERHDISAFIPFSLGPANCVGQKFAKRELFMVLSVLFKFFDMQFAEGFDSEAWPLEMQDFFAVTRGPLRLTTRSDNYV